jgi:hypothetical protein
MTDEVTKAEQTIGFLQEKQAAAIKRGHDLQEERAATALAAHTGDQGARAKLDALNLESAQHASELQSIGEALAAATNKLASARAAELRRQERADALRLRKAAKKFSDAGHRLDAVLADLPAAAQAVAAALNGVHQAGSPSPNHQQLLSLGGRALKTALMQTPWSREFEHLAPGERHSMAKLIDDWCERIDSAVDAKLKETEQQTTEAA